ncbi:MAG: YafY family transcriptional regulator [Hyphomicrobiales bacterium]|nr:YafY family transcriptional regulator [Hyphomicrobiales bacterium]
MTDRSLRLFEIIQILRCACAPVTARSLADRLEVTQRTIYRDIVTLQATGTPIDGAAGIGYVMRAGYNLPPLMFTADEIEAIVVGLSLVGRTGDVGLQTAASHVSGKIAGVLPDGAEESLEGTSLFVSRWNAVPVSQVDHRLMRRAIREEEKLRLQYQDAQKRETDRTVRPLALVYYIDSVILAAWCELRKNFRHFRLDRMLACASTGEAFKGEGRHMRTEWRSAHQLFSA